MNLKYSFSEGLLNTCAFEYSTDDWEDKSFVLFIVTFNFGIPFSFILFFYSQIVKAVWNHEKALRAQAKKMNVDSLRSNDVRLFSIHLPRND